MAGQRLGAACTEMCFVFFDNLQFFSRALARDQIALVGKHRSEKVTAQAIIGANLQAKTAFQAFCNRILLLMSALIIKSFFIVFSPNQADNMNFFTQMKKSFLIMPNDLRSS